MTERLPDKKRIDIIDAARGFSVILMVIHHALFDAVEYLGAPAWFFYNPVFYYCLHPLFAGLFVFLSGVSSRFSRSNIKRGIKVFAIAVLLTVVTSLPFVDQPIRFGVLHLLGFCMVFYGLTQKVWDKIPRVIAPVLYIVLIVGTALAVDLIFPWLFVFLLGTWAGAYITENRLPKWFYEKRVAVFPAVGKRALLIYILHQPILYGLTMLIIYLQGKG
jgi:uncharacterized membrane protein